MVTSGWSSNRRFSFDSCNIPIVKVVHMDTKRENDTTKWRNKEKFNFEGNAVEFVKYAETLQHLDLKNKGQFVKNENDTERADSKSSLSIPVKNIENNMRQDSKNWFSNSSVSFNPITPKNESSRSIVKSFQSGFSVLDIEKGETMNNSPSKKMQFNAKFNWQKVS